MTNEQSIRRRTILRTAGGIAIASIVAGCLTDSDSEDGKMPKNDVSYQAHPMQGQQCSGCQYFLPAKLDENTGKCSRVEGKIAPDAWCGLYTPIDAESGGNDGSDGSGGNDSTDTSSGSSSVDNWLADTDNYDSIEDMTSKTSITVEVGPENNDYVFAPAAIRINPETTVTWQWIGSGYHNVVARNGQFTSGEPAQNATFEYTFDTAGTNLYYCEPHKSMSMKGAVIVAGSDSTSAGNTTTQEANDSS